MSKLSQRKKFKKINLIAVISLFLVILAGAVVRSSGSGMGCPDWPKCFGRYVPPTDVSQLPKDYKQAYLAGRKKKNERFAKTLDLFGYRDLATRIRNDQSILVPEDFNAINTWTEYINRLIGALTGIFLLMTAIYSFSYWPDLKRIPLLSVGNLVLIFFQAWFGSIVVSTNLTSWTITVHMLIALAILAISIYTYHLALTFNREPAKVKAIVNITAIIALLLTIVQIVIGTDVREDVDTIASRLPSYREDWVNSIGSSLATHRTLAIVVLIANVMLYALVRKSYNRHSKQQQLMSFTFLMLMLQIVTGVILSYLQLPPAAQTAHLVIASVIFGAQFYLLLNLHRAATLKEGVI
ncbi:COX15/CtaA family protein [Mucilaginibacter sp. RS28]|uniref:COX15/CtaA family protein n=1 Tax=Mucilaginibacter straminoryzae TaxID=2932774 RepID=A0A9X2BA97_9SPHI|nr:COX15/CtaA family protein [Mucilaginibacter straminoryzae]MCJ8211604.1 COX15/CtaA family protein [Mucilaginibacter straminoryzae]